MRLLSLAAHTTAEVLAAVDLGADELALLLALFFVADLRQRGRQQRVHRLHWRRAEAAVARVEVLLVLLARVAEVVRHLHARGAELGHALGRAAAEAELLAVPQRLLTQRFVVRTAQIVVIIIVVVVVDVACVAVSDVVLVPSNLLHDDVALRALEERACLAAHQRLQPLVQVRVKLCHR
jgi:hypothetical protein